MSEKLDAHLSGREAPICIALLGQPSHYASGLGYFLLSQAVFDEVGQQYIGCKLYIHRLRLRPRTSI